MPSTIRAEAVVKRFRTVEAVRGLNIEVPPNSIYALVGPNGAGKTTAIKVLMNILRPTSGSAEVLGIRSTELRGEAFARIGYVSENQELPDSFRVGTLLSYLRPFYPTWDLKLENQLVQQFRLPRNRKLKELSRGMRMKASLASSLAYRPKLIVLDEPFTGLDPLVRDELIKGLSADADDKTVFVSTHDLSEIEGFATHIGYLERGRILFSEPLTSLLNRFREVEVTLGLPSPPRTSWPSTWIQITSLGTKIQFVDTGFDAVLTPALIRTELTEVHEIVYTPMSLRSIFLAVARSEETREPGDSA